MRLGQTKSNHTSNTNTLDLLTGDDLNEKDAGCDGWGDDDDFEDWGSLEEGRCYFRGIIQILIRSICGCFRDV